MPLVRMKRSTNTTSEILLVNWLAQVADDPIRQGAGPVNVVGVGSNEDCRNRVPRFDEVSVEFDAGHHRHMDVSDQAGRIAEMTGCEEIRRRCEDLDTVAQRPHESSHGIAKGRIVLNDRDQ